MKTPKKGQIVYIYHLTTERSRLGGAHALKPVPRYVVKEREFYKVIHPTWADGKERWCVKPVGKTEDFGTACKPEGIFATAQEARTALVAQLDTMIGKLSALLELAATGSNEGQLSEGGDK